MQAEKDWETPYLTMPHWPTLLFEARDGTPLERTKELLSRMGNPHLNLPPVVQVAGTNGKGSTIAFLRAMLEAAGYKVHAYTSPHLHRFNERIVLAGREIDDTTLFTAIETARMAAGNMMVSFFEGTTAAAFHAFASTPADIVLIETGCGGRFDPTNVIENPALSIITTISFDHMEILGNSLQQIAWHKAGILRPGVPCVISYQAPEALAVLEHEIEALGAIPCTYGTHWRVLKSENHTLRYATSDGIFAFPQPNLPGPHQFVNAGNALAAASILDFNIEAEHVQHGLTHAKWPARLERIETGARAALLPEGWELWVDGGHNMAAGHTLAAHIEASWQDKPTHIIFGTTQGKEVLSILGPLASGVGRIIGIPVISEPNSYSAQMLVNMLAPSGCPIEPAGSVEEAIETLTTTETTPARILVFGSLYLRVLVA